MNKYIILLLFQIIFFLFLVLLLGHIVGEAFKRIDKGYEILENIENRCSIK